MGEAKRRRPFRDDGHVYIPKEFWQSFTDEEMKSIAEAHFRLNAEQCQKLWRMTDRNTPPPLYMELEFNRADLERVAREEKKKKSVQ